MIRRLRCFLFGHKRECIPAFGSVLICCPKCREILEVRHDR